MSSFNRHSHKHWWLLKGDMRYISLEILTARRGCEAHS